jgi:sulfate/thiosulfate-binding protein
MVLLFALLTPAFACAHATNQAENTILHVSYDATRELLAEINRAFALDWYQKTGKKAVIRQSHGGSAKQARAVTNGLPADVISLATPYDVDFIARHGTLLPVDWRQHLLHQAPPFSSLIVFLTRHNNPKHIKNWPDLTQPHMQIIATNPKTSGGARWGYLAALGYALYQEKKDPRQNSYHFLRALYQNTLTLDISARNSVINFTRRGMGDVLIAWESDAHLAMELPGNANKYDIIIPQTTILAKPVFAVIEKNVALHHNSAIVKAYLAFFYSDEAQRIIANHFFRPVQYTTSLPASMVPFKKIRHILSADSLGSWDELHAKHFNEDGIFDQIME